MSSGIGSVDFVEGLVGQGRDWHGLTHENEKLDKSLFRNIRPEPLLIGGQPSPYSILMADDGVLCGKPFNPLTRVNLLPDRAWDLIADALSGTGFSFERLGLLWDRSFWFISVFLQELKECSRKGEQFQLNFSGSFDGSDAVQAELSSIRAVCWNTISLSRATGNMLFRLKQTKNSERKYADAGKEIERAAGMAAVFNEQMQSLESKPATLEIARAVYAGSIVRAGGNLQTVETDDGERSSRSLGIVDDMTTLFLKGDGNAGQTRADVLNGATQYYTRGMEGSKRDIASTMQSGMFGGNADRKAKFFSEVVDDKGFNSLLSEGRKALKAADAPEFELVSVGSKSVASAPKRYSRSVLTPEFDTN